MEAIPSDGGDNDMMQMGNESGPSRMLTLAECRDAVKSIFAGTSCYDLISASGKTIVFETTIPFQLAFYALIEHDTSVAPLWDPARHTFAGLMTIADYLNALKLCHKANISMMELSNSSIQDLINSPAYKFQHSDFSSIDAEDSVQTMCFFLNRRNTNFVPILNPDDGTLVSILGYLDLIHLLHQASLQHPELFTLTLNDMQLGIIGNSKPATLDTPIMTILNQSDDADNDGSLFTGGVPIIDEKNGKIIGIYHGTDVTFVTKATDSQSVLTNLQTFTVNDIFQLKGSGQQNNISGSRNENGGVTTSPSASVQTPATPALCTCTLHDTVGDILAVMMQARSSIVVVIDTDASQKFQGMLSIKDIVKFYLTG